MKQRDFSNDDTIFEVFLLKLNAHFEIRHIIRKAQPKQSKIKLFILTIDF